MRSPRFWFPEEARIPLAARLLAPLGQLYAFGASLRQRFSVGECAGIPVICIGNVTAGGAGKTPAAIFIAARLKEMGETPHFLSRGYGGRLKGPVRVDPLQHRSQDVGDEPLLLAAHAPAWVSQNRIAGARAAEEAGATVLVMDDGFQNPSLQKDLSFLVMDGKTGLGNGRVMPAGPLREPYEAALARADVLFLIGGGAAGDSAAEMAERAGLPLFTAALEADGQVARALKGKQIIAFAGIGRPEKFFSTLEETGADIVSRHSFPDHYAYRQRDIDRLAREAARLGATLVTTEKDLMRCRELSATGIIALPAALHMTDTGALDALLSHVLTRARTQDAYTPFEAPDRSA